MRVLASGHKHHKNSILTQALIAHLYNTKPHKCFRGLGCFDFKASQEKTPVKNISRYGRVTVKVVLPAFEVTATVPLCRATMRFTIERPMPLPSVERDESH